MLFKIIRQNKWTFLATCDRHGKSEILHFFGQLSDRYDGTRKRLLGIIDHASKEIQGPRLLPDDISHLIDTENKIFEFIAGDLRLLWFYSSVEQRVVICTTVFLKTSRKTPKKAIAKAIATQKLYLADVERGRIEIMR